MVSGSCACTSITNPKSVGRLPLTSRHESPASSERITSQSFCMNRTLGPEGAGGRDGGVHATGLGRIEQDGVETHPAGPRLPFGSRAVAAQTGELLPRRTPVARAKQRGVFHPGIHGVRIGERRLEVPDALELPGMLRAVVPLVRGKRFARVRRR